MRVSKRRGERAQATVEFAIIMPVLLLLVVGLIQFGKAFNYWLSLNHIANETARWASVDKLPPTTANPDVPGIQAYARDQAENQELRDRIEEDLTPLDDTSLENVLVCFKSSTGIATPQIGDAATIRVQAPYSLPLVSGFGDFDITLSGTSTVRLEQTPSNPASWDECS